MCFWYALVGLFALTPLSFASEDCPFYKLPANRLDEVAQFSQEVNPYKQLEMFAKASAEGQRDMIDNLASKRLAKRGDFDEVQFLAEMYRFARDSSARPEASRQALQHLIQVFYSGAAPLWYGEAKLEQALTGSGFGTGQSDLEFSRSRAIAFACSLAAEGLGGGYEDALLLAGLEAVQTGSAGRPPGGRQEIQSVEAGLRLLGDPQSKFPGHLKPIVLNLIPPAKP
jgi:hypothetical protein